MNSHHRNIRQQVVRLLQQVQRVLGAIIFYQNVAEGIHDARVVGTQLVSAHGKIQRLTIFTKIVGQNIGQVIQGNDVIAVVTQGILIMITGSPFVATPFCQGAHRDVNRSKGGIRPENTLIQLLCPFSLLQLFENRRQLQLQT